jgi:hypothetical protein
VLASEVVPSSTAVPIKIRVWLLLARYRFCVEDRPEAWIVTSRHFQIIRRLTRLPLSAQLGDENMIGLESL